jgi:hypothetical protein
MGTQSLAPPSYTYSSLWTLPTPNLIQRSFATPLPAFSR